MAQSRFEYVKDFEANDSLLPHCWIVVRIDGKGFTRFAEQHGFAKPNDRRALDLMDACAVAVMQEFGRVIRIAYGESDEYSFVFHKMCKLYNRRASKLISLVASLFAATYVQLWKDFMPDTDLKYVPMFDARAVCYPSDTLLRDYLSWRQADTHVNNQYNTCFWALRQQGAKTAKEAQEVLKGTLAREKNELLFSQFGINYNELPLQFRKGSVIIWLPAGDHELDVAKGQTSRLLHLPQVLHVDIIGPGFWKEHSHVLND